ncbi:MAG: tetratricopeptide repeat protein, partial [Nitrospiraceae bacterium]|nr:tetratricopeptide repeat protein [Nitrospiraceae bacterium]
MDNKTTQIDVLIITAVKDELDVVRKIESDWEQREDNSGFDYYIRTNTDIDNPGNELTIAVARAFDKGGDYASNIATRLVSELKPRCLAMVGKCAGRRNEVFLGDVIVAERVFRCDGGKLKVFKEGDVQRKDVFHDIRTYNLNPKWKMRAEEFSTDWIKTVETPRPTSYNYQEEWLGYAIDAFEKKTGDHPRDRSDRETGCPDWTKIIERLKDKDLVCIDGDLKLTDKGKQWITEHKISHLNGPKPDPDKPISHVAPMGTGNQIQEDPELFEIIGRYERDTLGFDMEAAAIGAVAEIEDVDSRIIVKSVSDYGDHDKNDHFREYAIETSYRFLMAFLKENVSPRPKEVPFILPQIDVSTFTGRDEELEQLEEMLVKKEGSKICTVFGMSCVGKSALACHFAENQKANFPDGVIGLRVDGKDADTIVREFARSYGDKIDPDDERDATAIMQELFGQRKLLLIFDNADDSKTIRSLIPGGDRCAVIVTTRDRNLPDLLDIPTERRIEVLPLPVPDSLHLLEKLLGEERISDEQVSACNIIELVGRLPLALKIVGATLRGWQSWRSLSEYEESLSEERTRLSKLQYPGDVDLNVRASISLSLKRLEPEEIDFFSCLSICAESGFSLQAAMSAGDCDESTVHERLGCLYRFSLLNRSGSNRFVFHSLIYLFARELAADRSLREVASERHANFFIALLKSSDMADRSAASTIAEEIEDIILAARWLLQQEQSDREFVIRLGKFFSRYGHWQQAVDLMSGFRSLAERDEDWNAAVQSRIQQAKYLSMQGKWSPAAEVLAPIADILPKIGDQAARKHHEAMWLNSIGGVLQRQGHFDEAEDSFKRSAAIEEVLDNKHGLAKVLNSLGGVLRSRGRFKEANDAVRRSYDLLVEIGDQRGQAMVLTSLGYISRDRGDFEGAKDFLKRSAAIEERLGNQRGLSMALNSLGGVLQRQGHFDEAEKELRRSIGIDEKLGNERGLSMALHSLGGVLQDQGHSDEAEKTLRHSITIGEKLDDERHLSMVLHSLGGVLQDQGKFDEAEKELRRSIGINEKLDDERGLAITLTSLGGVLQDQGKFDEAAKTLRRSIGISEKLDDERGLSIALNSLGGVLQRQGHFDEAEKTLRRSIGINEKLDDERGLSMALNSLGGVLQDQGKFDEAEKTLRRGIGLSEKLDDERGLVMALTSLGGVLQRQGHFDEAEK